MSNYYNIKGLKVRVSDHEPNFSMDKFRGVNDVELYVKSLCNELLSIEGQIESICEKRDYNISDFQEIINDWKDGSYDSHVFEKKVEELEEVTNNDEYDSLNKLIADTENSYNEKLKGCELSRFAKHAEIKALSEKIGVSQSYIKKYFNI